MLAWGKKVSAQFRSRVSTMVIGLGGVTPNDLMGCIGFETKYTFSPSIRNSAGSGAIGLIQFMSQTAGMLGTSIEALGRMTAEGQLEYVARYLAPYKGRLHNLGDIYGSILWPAMIGKADTDIVFTKDGPRPALYIQNAGLDTDKDGNITRGEVIKKVAAGVAIGLLPANSF